MTRGCSVPLVGKKLSAPVVAMAAASSGAGYWLVTSDGQVFRFGDARYFGSVAPKNPRAHRLSGSRQRPQDRGYWLVGSDGKVYNFGTAENMGSAPAAERSASSEPSRPWRGIRSRGKAWLDERLPERMDYAIVR